MTGALHDLFHVLLLRCNLTASLPPTRRTSIGSNMNWNLEKLKPMLLLSGGERELLTALYTLPVLVHIPHRRTVRIMSCVFRQVGLDCANRHLLQATLVI